ncbi:MAG: MFS transporter [Patescibacteria group bacterium]
MQITNIKSWRSALVLLVTIAITAIIFFEGGAVSVAVPHIQREFGANLSQIQWVANSYALVLSVFILISGSLGDIFNRKKIILVGLALFGGGGLFAGIAQNIPEMLIFRVIQGLGGAILMPQSLAIINAEFVSKIQGKAIGIWTASTSFLLIFGAYLAGLMIDNWGWRSVFISTFPLSAVCAILTYFILGKDVRVKRVVQSFDWAGMLTLGLGLFGIFFALIQIPVLGWTSWQIICAALAGVVFLIGFVLVERRIKYPLIDFQVLAKNNILAANVFTLLLYATSNGLLFFISIFMQQVLGFSAANAGLGILPMVVSIVLLSVISGSLADKVQSKLLMLAGALMVSGGFLWMGINVTQQGYWTSVAPGLVLVGSGFGLFIPSLTKEALNVEPKHSGLASGLNNSVSTIAGLLGVAVFSLLVSSLFSGNLKTELNQSDFNSEQKSQALDLTEKLIETPTPSNLNSDQKNLFEDMKKSSFTKAYKWELFVSASICLMGAGSAVLLKSSKRKEE